MWNVKSRHRRALIEEDVEIGKMRGTFYLTPHHVKHHSTKQFVEFNYVVDPDFASEVNCRVFAQNAHVALEVYDFYVKLFDPDYETVSVYDERFTVQYLFKTTPSETWRSVDAYNPVVETFPLSDGVKIRKTFDTDSGPATLQVSYIVRTGRHLKHQIVFTNRDTNTITFRVHQQLSGITGTKLKVKGFPEGDITGPTEFKLPYFFVNDGINTVLFENLRSLGIREVNTEWTAPPDPIWIWTPVTLENIVIDTHAQGSKADIYIGRYVLAENESLEIDPDSSTWQVGASADDAWVYATAAVPHHGSWLAIAVADDEFLAGGTVTDATQLWLGAGGRFTNVTIPASSTIDSAYLKVTALVSRTETTVNTRIYGEDVDDAAAFSTVANYNGRTQTSAFVDWDSISSWTINVEYSSPDIKTIIQEIIDRGGWASGQDMVVFWEDHGSSTGVSINGNG